MPWDMPTNEPCHAFVLVEAYGNVAWIRDYGAPERGGAMYVTPDELTPQVRESLNGS
jgi:hypothetical protein